MDSKPVKELLEIDREFVWFHGSKKYINGLMSDYKEKISKMQVNL
jgi:hypothetical protein